MIDYTYKFFEKPTIPELKIWFLVELFFSAHHYYFKNIYLNYERQVLQIAEQQGIDRRNLRLTVEELSRLINYSDLKILRDNILSPLREISHELFRDDRNFDPLDSYISALFHEISILKDIYFQLNQIALTFKDFDQEEINTILDEVHEQFPQKTQHIHKIFAKAFNRLQRILPQYKDNIFLLRCAFFEAKGIFQDQISLDEFFSWIFEGNPVWGYYLISKSFCESAFYPQASECYLLAQEKLEKLQISSKKAE
ncbi:MAG: hypothetical protein AABZ60_10400 [Planctomycetota bacterium]